MKGKILLVAPGGCAFEGPFSRSFSKLGYECRTFDYRDGLVYTNPLVKKILHRIPALKFTKKLTVEYLNRKLLETVREFKPTFLYSQKAESIYPETIEKIKKMGVTTINFYNDQMAQWHGIRELAPVYDYFGNECHLVLRRLWHELGLKNCFYLAHSSEPVPEATLHQERKYNISFIGTYNKELYQNRERFLSTIADLGLHIWGSDGWKNTSLRNCFHGRAHGDERLEIYANSKIVIDINYDFIAAEGIGNRPFEVTGAGAMLMIDDIRADIHRAFAPGREVIVFKDAKDLREKAEYYTAHDDERKKIAQAGYQRTLTSHTYDHRVAQIFDTLQNPTKYINT